MSLPKGFRFDITGPGHGGFTVNLYKGDTLIGELNVRRVRGRSGNRWITLFETHSHLDDEFHNRGLGIELYAKAIEYGLGFGLNVASSWAPSKKAQRAWTSQRLAKRYDIVKLAKRWWVMERR